MSSPTVTVIDHHSDAIGRSAQLIEHICEGIGGRDRNHVVL